MPDTYTYMIFGYGILVGGLMIYTISLGIRQHILQQRKKDLEEQAKKDEQQPPNP